MPHQHISQIPRLGTLMSSLDGHQRVNLQCRVIVLGAAKVGKTAIIEQFLYETFPVMHLATVEQLYRAEYQVRGAGLLTLDILDTSGSYEFPAMRQLAIKSADAFILVFSVDDTESFEEVRRLRELIFELKTTDNNESQPLIPICVVGNKNDLEDKRVIRKKRNQLNNLIIEMKTTDNNESQQLIPICVVGNKIDLENKRVIRKEVAESIICLDWENGYVECSAKDNMNVVKIFQELMIQAKVPYDVGPAIANGKPRRSSLPEYPTSPVNRDKGTAKRNSCALS